MNHVITFLKWSKYTVTGGFLLGGLVGLLLKTQGF